MSASDSASAITEPSPQRLAAWITLSLCNGIGPVLLRRLLDALQTPENILAATAGQLAQVDGIGSSRAHAIARGREQINVDDILAD